MVELNQINLSGWAQDPNVSIQISAAIEKASWVKSPFDTFAGIGHDRGVRTFKVDKAAPYRPRLKAALQGTGVVGNADFDTNLDKLEILSQTVFPKVIGNSLKSEIEYYSAIKNIDFLKEAIDSLTDWDAQLRDRCIACALVNDFTNAVIADKANGFKDTTKEKDVVSATRKIAADDVITVNTIRRAIFMARTGIGFNGKKAFPIKPTRCENTTLGDLKVQFSTYLILLDSFQIEQLKRDPEWKEMQQVGVRGDKNNIFTGFAGVIDSCPILDMKTWGDLEIGLPDSNVSDETFNRYINPENFSKIVPPSAYTGGVPLSIGALIGASAVVCVGSEMPKFYITKNEDLGRKIMCGVDRVLGISKARYQPNGAIKTPYDNLDFGCIGIFSAQI